MDQSINFEQMRQMINMFSNFSGPRETPSPKSEKSDDRTPESMRILKTVMPFMESPAKGQLGILLKCMELKNTVSYYEQEVKKKDTADFQRSASSKPKNEFSPRKQREMLKSIRDVCGKDKQHIIDMALQTLQMQEFMKMNQPHGADPPAQPPGATPASRQDGPPSNPQPDLGSVLSYLRPEPSKASPQNSAASNSSLSEQLKEGLTPEQQQMLDNLSSFMNNTPPKGAPNE